MATKTKTARSATKSKARADVWRGIISVKMISQIFSPLVDDAELIRKRLRGRGLVHDVTVERTVAAVSQSA